MMRNDRGQFELANGIIWGIVGFVVAVIVGLLIVSSLGEANLFADTSSTQTITNETGWVNRTGYTLNGLSGFNSSWSSITITQLYNTTSGATFLTSNASVNQATGVVTNASATEWNAVKISYTFTLTQNALEQNAASNIQTNLSSGVNTVTAKIPTVFTVIAIVIILAILGILVALVVRSGMGGGNFSQ